MVNLIFRRSDGSEQKVEAQPGESVMEAAKRNDIDEIVAECGGSCACATCHVFFDAENFAITGPPSDIESSMLDFAAEPHENSRLSCQIQVEDHVDGLLILLPETQQ